MGSIPVFLINNHRIDTIEDAEAYVSRLRDVERAMSEISSNIRRQASLGIVPPRFNFAPVGADARRVLSGAPFGGDRDGAVFADFKAKVGRLQVGDDVKARLIAEARASADRPRSAAATSDARTLDAIEPRATGKQRRLEPAARRRILRQPPAQSTTTDLTPTRSTRSASTGARDPRRDGADQAAVGFAGTLRSFFDHINAGQQFKYANSDEGGSNISPTRAASSTQVMAAAPRYFRRLPARAAGSSRGRDLAPGDGGGRFYNQPSADGSRPGIYYVNTRRHEPGAAPAKPRRFLPRRRARPSLPDRARPRSFQTCPSSAASAATAPMSRAGVSIQKGLRPGDGLLPGHPNQLFGMYSTQQWRAIRLVVDTRYPHHRWTRERATDYFLENGLLCAGFRPRREERIFQQPGQRRAT
jgi:uncharacterized protein (DUF885 family)